MTYRHLSLIRDTLTYEMLSPLMVTLTHMYNIWLSSKVGLVNTTKTIDVPPKHSQPCPDAWPPWRVVQIIHDAI